MIKSNTVDREFFAQYISYARKTCRPKIDESITNDLVQEYMKLRGLGSTTKTVTATPRQLESMIRLSEALAKMRLSPMVERKDVDEAVRLIKHALQQAATDPRTGKINMDILTTGQTKTSAERLKMICDFIKSLMQTYPEKVMKDGLKYSNLLDLLTNKAKEGKFSRSGDDDQDREFTEKEYREALKILEDEDIVSLIGHTSAPIIRFRILDVAH